MENYNPNYGANYIPILSRWLDADFINLGFYEMAKKIHPLLKKY